MPQTLSLVIASLPDFGPVRRAFLFLLSARSRPTLLMPHAEELPASGLNLVNRLEA